MNVVCRNQADGSELLIQSRNIRAAPGSVKEDQSGTIEQAVEVFISNRSNRLSLSAHGLLAQLT
jgi:hypothetical protein